MCCGTFFLPFAGSERFLPCAPRPSEKHASRKNPASIAPRTFSFIKRPGQTTRSSVPPFPSSFGTRVAVLPFPAERSVSLTHFPDSVFCSPPRFRALPPHGQRPSRGQKKRPGTSPFPLPQAVSAAAPSHPSSPGRNFFPVKTAPAGTASPFHAPTSRRPRPLCPGQTGRPSTRHALHALRSPTFSPQRPVDRPRRRSSSPPPCRASGQSASFRILTGTGKGTHASFRPHAHALSDDWPPAFPGTGRVDRPFFPIRSVALPLFATLPARRLLPPKLN